MAARQIWSQLCSRRVCSAATKTNKGFLSKTPLNYKEQRLVRQTIADRLLAPGSHFSDEIGNSSTMEAAQREAAALLDSATERYSKLNINVNMDSEKHEKDKVWKHVRDLSLKLAEERARGVPLAYISGRKDFFQHSFRVTPDVLVPRPETELIVETVLAVCCPELLHPPFGASAVFADGVSVLANYQPAEAPPWLCPQVASHPGVLALAESRLKRRLSETAAGHAVDMTPKSILDLGTGSGCILGSLLAAFPHAHGVGVDISADALHVAKSNFPLEHGTLGVTGCADRVEFYQGSWLDAFPTEEAGGSLGRQSGSSIVGPFDVLTSNPPYLTNAEWGIADLADPKRALAAGADGLSAFRSLRDSILARRPLLADGALAVIEIGAGQEVVVQELFDQIASAPPVCIRDLAGKPRVIAFALKEQMYEDRIRKIPRA